ncbi:MAG: hypothetical protein ACREUL_14300 [Steroidobacteraceae bacterium]
MLRRSPVRAALVAATLLAPLSAYAASPYTLTDLGTLGGDTSGGLGINDSGEVTGYSTTSGGLQHAFLYNGSSMTDLGTLGGDTSGGLGINDSGEVTGIRPPRATWLMTPFCTTGRR